MLHNTSTLTEIMVGCFNIYGSHDFLMKDRYKSQISRVYGDMDDQTCKEFVCDQMGKGHMRWQSSARSHDYRWRSFIWIERFTKDRRGFKPEVRLIEIENKTNISICLIWKMRKESWMDIFGIFLAQGNKKTGDVRETQQGWNKVRYLKEQQSTRGVRGVIKPYCLWICIR